MWAPHWLFWMVPVLFFALLNRRRRWERWAERRAAFAPDDPYGIDEARAGIQEGMGRGRGAVRGSGGRIALQGELETQRELVDTLEKRIALLEERLDFTEQLLEQRKG